MAEGLDLTRDFNYFQSIWEAKKNGEFKHTAKVWDSRADDWEKELAKDGSFRKSLDERVKKVTEYLQAHQLLQAGSEVLDIGCGLGRFVAEFAKTCGHVTGIDLSGRMLEVGADYARECGLHNVTFLAGDFGEFDLAELGWEGKFDLVFTSITPAVGTVETLAKAMKISRGYCFNSCFICWEDELEKQIAGEVFHREYAPSLNSHGRGFYSLFNLLWLMGYFPETSYHLQEQLEYVDADEDLARYYAKCFSNDMLADEENIRCVHEYLKEHAGADGTILRQYKRWYGWILWDVRTRLDRIATL